MRRMKRSMICLLSLMLFMTGCGKRSSDNSEQDADTGSISGSSVDPDSVDPDSVDTDSVDSEQISVVAILKARNSLTWHYVEEGLEKAADDYDMKMNVIWPESEDDADVQERMVEDAIKACPDVILWAPDDSKTADQYAEKVTAAGIDLFYLDDCAEKQNGIPYIGSDNYHAGELAAQSIAETITGEAEVAVIAGSQGQQVHRQRAEGFMDYISKNTSLTCVEIKQVPDCSLTGAAEKMEELFEEHPYLEAVFCASAQMVMGALETCQNRSQTVTLVGMDTQTDALKAVSSGKIHAIISQGGYEMGYRSVMLVAQKMQGEEIELMNYIGNEIITRENVEEFMDEFVMEGRD